jgi:hypothetical protein
MALPVLLHQIMARHDSVSVGLIGAIIIPDPVNSIQTTLAQAYIQVYPQTDMARIILIPRSLDQSIQNLVFRKIIRAH